MSRVYKLTIDPSYGSRADIKSEFPNLPSSYFTPQIIPTITDGGMSFFDILGLDVDGFDRFIAFLRPIRYAIE